MKRATLKGLTITLLISSVLTGCQSSASNVNINSTVDGTADATYNATVDGTADATNVNVNDDETTFNDTSATNSSSEGNTSSDSILKSLNSRIESDLVYNEASSSKDFNAYFNILARSTSNYMIAEKDNENYLIFLYLYSNYGARMKKINSITKTYDNNRLHIKMDAKIEPEENIGCAPLWTNVAFIIKLDQDINGVTIDSETITGAPYEENYEEFEWGIVSLPQTEKCGVIDKDLNIIVPFEYENIFPFTTYSPELTYYRAASENGNGLYDNHFNMIIKPEYNNIYSINEDRYIVTKSTSNSSFIDETKIYALDGNGKEILGPVEGFINGNDRFSVYKNQIVFLKLNGGNALYGVIDADLKIIIEPIYKDIVPFSMESSNLFYVVENNNGEFAVIDSDGIQQTAFEKTSVYDVQTAYYDNHIYKSYGK